MSERDDIGQGVGDGGDGDGGPLPPWEDLDPTPAEPPEEWLALPQDFSGDGEPPPQLVRTVNLLDAPEHDLRGPEDVDALAAFLVARAGEGVVDVFGHPDYDRCDGEGERWARAIAEHQTGIPYTMPVYFYGSQRDVAKAVGREGRYPLVGQCQQSVTTALCLGGWDGGSYGDIGSGLGSQEAAARLGRGWKPDALALASWPEELWREVGVGSCLFWSLDCTCGKSPHVQGCKGLGSGHVAMVIRKHPTERKWQLWDTTTSFQDPAAHAAASKGARMLWESHWWSWIPRTITAAGWAFRGIAQIDGLGQVRSDLRPRGRCRLLLRRRGDRQLLFRSEWMSMEAQGLPISWLLRSLRKAPFFDRIEPIWCVNSQRGGPGADDRPLLDVSCDAAGNARMTWNPQQGLHNRPRDADWWTPAALGGGAARGAPARVAPPPPAVTARVAPPPPVASASGALRSEPLAGQPRLEQIAAGAAPALRQGASGPPVRALQEALARLGFDVPGGADGVFGAGTTRAVQALQAQRGLAADGVVGAGTLRAIDERLDADRAPPA